VEDEEAAAGVAAAVEDEAEVPAAAGRAVADRAVAAVAAAEAAAEDADADKSVRIWRTASARQKNQSKSQQTFSSSFRCHPPLRCASGMGRFWQPFSLFIVSILLSFLFQHTHTL